MSIDQEGLKKIIHYDPETGNFSWLAYGKGKRESLAAGCLSPIGYVHIGINRKLYLAHRLAFLWMDGSIPDEQVDHINGVRNDNRWSNLRRASQSENARNTKLHSTNSSGAIGVSWDGRRSAWRVRIGVQWIGYYRKFEDAVDARKEAEKANNYHQNHGRV